MLNTVRTGRGRGGGGGLEGMKVTRRSIHLEMRGSVKGSLCPVWAELNNMNM